jgi:Flp pilus assembly protein TadD
MAEQCNRKLIMEAQAPRHFAGQSLTGLALALILLVLNGCASSSQSGQVHSSVEGQGAPITDLNGKPRRPHPLPSTLPGTGEDSTRPPENVAVAGLLQQAAQARAQGDFARAQILAERAQSLSPHEAQSYLELSRIYLNQGDKNRSRQMALRGLSVIRNDPATENQLQQLSAP